MDSGLKIKTFKCKHHSIPNESDLPSRGHCDPWKLLLLSNRWYYIKYTYFRRKRLLWISLFTSKEIFNGRLNFGSYKFVKFGSVHQMWRDDRNWIIRFSSCRHATYAYQYLLLLKILNKTLFRFLTILLDFCLISFTA